MADRDYQIDAVNANFKAWQTHRSILDVLATGLGKTRIMTMMVERILPGRTIFLAHRIELIFQARMAFLERGIECEIEQGELTASTNLFTQAPVVLAMVQTLSSGEVDKKRMKRFNPQEFDLLLYDESHHSVSKGNKLIVDYFKDGNPNLKVLGMTATPNRLDMKALGQIFQHNPVNKDIVWGWDNGWLVEPRQQIIHSGALDFSHIKTTAGDLNSAELAQVMEQEEPSQKIKQTVLEAMFDLPQNELLKHPVESWGKLLMASREPRRTIVFTVSVKQAETLAGIFNRVIPGIANFVHGGTPDYEREHMLRSFKEGTTAIMVNCDVLTEGYDNPYTEIIALGRPTKSLSKYIQWIGRGTRPIPGIVDDWPDSPDARKAAIAASVKPYCTVIDFQGNAGRHKLIGLVDVLGGDMTPEIRERVVKRIEQEKTAMQVKEVIAEEAEKLRQEIERKRLEKEAARARLLARVQYSSTEISPFDAYNIMPPRARVGDTRQLSDAQIRMLVGQDINPATLSYADGARMAGEIARRFKLGLAQMKQCAVIRRHYPEIDVRTLTRKRASAILDKLAQNNWRKVDITNI